MWGLVLILVVLVLLLGLGYVRLLSALKDLQEQIQKKLQSGSGVRLTSQVSKKELSVISLIRSSGPIGLPFKRKRPWIWPSVILLMIFGRL